MPERFTFLIVATASDAEQVMQKLTERLNDGWIVDQNVNQSSGRGKPIALDNAIVYHLIKYSDEELEAMAKEKELADQELFQHKQGPHVLDTQYADTRENRDEVNALLKKGYTIKQEWAAKALLYLYEGDEINPELKKPPETDEPDERS